MALTVITPTIRLAGALRAAESVQAARALVPDLEVRHVIAYWAGPPDPDRLRMGAWMTSLIRACAHDWLVFVDDDNLMHPQFLKRLVELTQAYPQIGAFLFASAYPAFNGGVLHPQLPPHVGYIDGGQAVIKSDYATRCDWPAGRSGDGLYLASLYALAPERWMAVDEVLTSHNAQEWS